MITMMKNIRYLLTWLWKHKLVTALIILPLVTAVYYLIPKNKNVIETVEAKRQKIIQSITASGSIVSAQSVNLSFISSGKLTYLGTKKGDRVVRGQTIASLDQRTLKTNLVQTLEDYAKQRNTFDQTQDQYLDHTPADALSDAMKRILEDNQNDLDKAVNSVELQKLAIENSVLTSPIDGIVTRADVEVTGVNVSSTTTFTIADPDALMFNVEVDEADIGKIREEMVMEVTFDAFPDNKVPLIINFIDFTSHTSDAGATVYTVKASLQNTAESKYRIGMNGDAEIVLAEKNNALTIPLSCLIDENRVYIKKDKGFELRKVKTGLQSDVDIEILSGLKEGEIVVLIPEEVEKIINKK